MILELQGKTEEMLQVLLGPLAVRLNNISQRKAVLFQKMKRFEEATRAYEELIRKE